MPTYCYHCEQCDEHFEVFHSMKSTETVCAVCGAEDCLTRVPSMPIYFNKNTAGNIVKQHIEDAKQQLAEDKKEARQEYK